MISSPCSVSSELIYYDLAVNLTVGHSGESSVSKVLGHIFTGKSGAHILQLAKAP